MTDLPVHLPGVAWRQLLAPVIWAGALGYLVDIFDMNLGANYRQQMFHSFGVGPDQTVSAVVSTTNWARSGFVLGGFLWGILGDKIGRIFSLFGSIALYSTAVLLVAIFCHSLSSYKVGSFFVSLGLAGELGGSVTLVLESLPTTLRTFGVMFIAAVGMIGVLFAGLLVEVCSWRTAFFLGAVMGFLLLIFRFRVRESLLFERLESGNVTRGNWFALLWPRRELEKYLACILLGVPPLFVLFFYTGFVPELAQEMHISGDMRINRAAIVVFLGMALGDFLIAWLSFRLKSRKRPILWFLSFSGVLQCLLLTCHGAPSAAIYTLLFFLGLASGNGLYVTTVAEQFGTNLRDTAATTITNFIRFSVVPLGFLLTLWKSAMGLAPSGFLISLGCLAVGILALSRLRETYGGNLDYVEAAAENSQVKAF